MKTSIVIVAVFVVFSFIVTAYFFRRHEREKSEFEITYAAELSAARRLLQDERSRSIFDNQVIIYANPNYTDMGIYYPNLYRWVADILDNANFARYFHPLVPVSLGDTVIDAGSLTGYISMNFSNKVGPSGKVIVFEPDPLAIKINVQHFKAYEVENVEIVPMALWYKNDTITFYFGNDASGSLFGDGSRSTVEVEAVTLDYFVKTRNIERVDFIKMHIEGAEKQALIGAEYVLRRDKPNLAIAVYHRPRHLFEIILWLNALDIGYEFWMDVENPKRYIWQKLNLYARSTKRMQNP